jgi:hypothetical protein
MTKDFVIIRIPGNRRVFVKTGHPRIYINFTPPFTEGGYCVYQWREKVLADRIFKKITALKL